MTQVLERESPVKESTVLNRPWVVQETKEGQERPFSINGIEIRVDENGLHFDSPGYGFLHNCTPGIATETSYVSQSTIPEIEYIVDNQLIVRSFYEEQVDGQTNGKKVAYECTITKGLSEGEQAFPAITMKVKVRNEGAEPIQVSRLHILDSDTGFNESPKHKIGTPGWNSWSQYQIEDDDRYWPMPGDVVKRKRDPLQSRGSQVSDIAVMSTDKTHQMVAGATTMDKYETLVDFTRNEKGLGIQCWNDTLHQEVQAGQTIESEELILIFGDDQTRLFGQVSQALAKNLHIPPVDRENLPGNNYVTWYKYRNKITPEIITSAIDAINGHPELTITEFTCDDGFQQGMVPGSWTILKPEFLGISDQEIQTILADPGGQEYLEQLSTDVMRGLTDYMKQNGLEPWIWSAPFLVGNKSWVAQKHPDWLLKNPDGTNRSGLEHNPYWTGETYTLDYSQPEAREYLMHCIDTFVNKWGFEGLKLDFIYAGRIDKSLAEYRKVLEEIMDVAGPDIDFLLCGAPLAQSAGIKGRRVRMRPQPDNHRMWRNPDKSPFDQSCEGAGNNIKATILRALYASHFYYLDPDCDVSADCPPDMDNDFHLTSDEYDHTLTSTALCNSMSLPSADFKYIDPAHLRKLEKLSFHTGETVAPIDYYGDGPPPISCMQINRPFGNYKIMGFHNWADEAQGAQEHDPARLGLDPNKKYFMYNLIDGNLAGTTNGTVPVEEIPIHGVKLYSVHEVHDHPQLLATDLTWLGGPYEVRNVEWHDNDLHILLNMPIPRDGEIAVFMPQGYELKDHLHHRIEQSAGGNVLHIPVHVDGDTSVKIQFRKNTHQE